MHVKKCMEYSWLVTFCSRVIEKSMLALIGQITLGEGFHHKTKVNYY